MKGLGVAIAASAVVANAEVHEYDLSCQVPTNWVRVRHVVDVSADMAKFNDALENGALKSFYDYMNVIFDDGNAQGLMSFSNKKSSTSPQDKCAAIEAPLAFEDVSTKFAAMERDVALGGEKRTVMDALYIAASEDWDTPLNKGRTYAFVYTNKLPELPPNGETPFTPGCDCETCASPSPSAVASIFNEVYQYVIFVVTADVHDAYVALVDAMGINALVVPLIANPAVQFDVLKRSIDSAYCGSPPPTQPPQGSTGEQITSPPVCSENAVLQLVHLQDMSWSYTNDLANIRAKFPELLQLLDEKFHERRVALGSFVDKPSGDSGYPGDYCYKQETSDFTTNADEFTAAFDKLKILSGKDWMESQYDAMWETVHDGGLSWITTPEMPDGKQVLKVVMVATDAGPHIRGDAQYLPPVYNNLPCHERDYPRANDLGAALDDKGIYPIFIVTSDIYNYWTKNAASVSANAKVLHLSQPAQDLFQTIVDALEDICATEAAKTAALKKIQK